jgi:hypothetical protein
MSAFGKYIRRMYDTLTIGSVSSDETKEEGSNVDSLHILVKGSRKNVGALKVLLKASGMIIPQCNTAAQGIQFAETTLSHFERFLAAYRHLRDNCNQNDILVHSWRNTIENILTYLPRREKPEENVCDDEKTEVLSIYLSSDCKIPDSYWTIE